MGASVDPPWKPRVFLEVPRTLGVHTMERSDMESTETTLTLTPAAVEKVESL